MKKGYHGNGIFQNVTQVGPVHRSADLFGDFPNKIALFHIFRAKDIEHIAVCAAVLDGGGRLAAACITHYPGSILVGLCV